MFEQAFSSIDQVAQCMADEERSNAFGNAIKQVVKPHHSVADIGVGTGILALFAAQAGSVDVTALEYDPYVAAVARENVIVNGFDHEVNVVEGDACSFDFSRSKLFDVVIMEMLTTGMIDEMQVPAVNNLHRQGLISPETIVIPYRVDTFASLANVRFDICGLNMKMIRHLWKGFPETAWTKCISDELMLSSVEFTSPCPEFFQGTLSFEIKESGVVNALYLTSKTFLTPDITLGDTLTLNAPVVIPLPDLKVEFGDRVNVEIRFKYGGGYENFRVKILSLHAETLDRKKALQPAV